MDLITTNGQFYYQGENVQIRDLHSIPSQTVQTLKRAGGVVDNYANAHGSKITFYDARRDMGDADFYTVDKMLMESIGINVQNKGEKFSQTMYVNRYGNDVDGKPFLKAVYERIQKLVEGKDLRIVEEKAQTMQELIKAGKVKV